MKFFILVLLILLTASCTLASSPKNVNSSDVKTKQITKSLTDLTNLAKVSDAVQTAKKNKDYRFLATSGRSTTVPGVDLNSFQTLIELCGIKYSSAAGDVIRSPEQRLARKEHVDFMRQYNEKILVICRESQEK